MTDGDAPSIRPSLDNRNDRNIRHVVLDLDGTIYRDDRVLPETLPFLATLAERGITCTFMTNNTSRAVGDYVAKLASMGIAVDAERIVTPVAATVAHLNNAGATRVFVLGTSALQAELAGQGFTILGASFPGSATGADTGAAPDAVVVGFDSGLTYEALCRAAWWISNGVPFLATHPDMVCPTDEATVLVDCGAICAALTAATGRPPDAVFGKPDPAMIELVVLRTGVPAAQIAVIGDRLYTDMALGGRAGCRSILVLTGEATRSDVEALPPGAVQRPEAICPTLGEVLGEL